MAVSGYTVPWHTAAGTPVALHVSSSRPVRAVRIVRLDTPSPAVMDWHVEPTGNAASHRDFDHGSFPRIAASELAKATDISGVSFEVYLTRNDGARVLFECGNFRLGLQDGRLTSGHDGKPLEPGETLPANTWLTVEISSDGSGTILKIGSDDLLGKSDKRRVTAKFTVTNLTNVAALYNFLSTFSGTHWVAPRTFQAEIGYVF